ncbi:MAG: hypothetical protein ACKVTZ_17215 [Bacteroidia bacterium]
MQDFITTYFWGSIGVIVGISLLFNAIFQHQYLHRLRKNTIALTGKVAKILVEEDVNGKKFYRAIVELLTPKGKKLKFKSHLVQDSTQYLAQVGNKVKLWYNQEFDEVSMQLATINADLVAKYVLGLSVTALGVITFLV